MPIGGNTTFTPPQLDEMNRRLDVGGLYVDTNFNNQRFFGDGNQIRAGAEEFLNQEQNGGFVNEFTWSHPGRPIPEYDAGPWEPTPPYSPAGSATLNLEFIHYASVLSAVWKGRTASITFSGETKSKDAHAQDLARAVFDVILRRSQDPKLDFGDTGRWARGTTADGNPHFITMSKMSKYLTSFSLIYDQLGGYSSYVNNVSLVDTWFSDAAAFGYDRSVQRANRILGANWRSFAPNSYAVNNSLENPRLPAGNSQNHTHYNSAGVGQYSVSNAQVNSMTNRMMDFASYVSNYGALYNNQFYKDYAWDVFRCVMMIQVFPDGTYAEWYRSWDANPTIGITYATLSIFKVVADAYRHAVGVQNGVVGLTDIGKYYDYTTSIGTDELYSVYRATSTSGGNKGIRLMVENMSKWYRTTANGGWSDVRYAEGGNFIDSYNKPFTVFASMANTYYQDPVITDYYKFNTAAGYTGSMGWFNGFGVASAGAWTEHSLGLGWAESGLLGGYWGTAEMEGIVFNGVVPPTTEPENNIRNNSSLVYLLNL